MRSEPSGKHRQSGSRRPLVLGAALVLAVAIAALGAGWSTIARARNSDHLPAATGSRAPVSSPTIPPRVDDGMPGDPGTGLAEPRPPRSRPSSSKPPKPPSVPPSIRQGSVGPAVEDLQNRLNGLGYTVTGIDGVFGEETLHAVVAFQKVSGLSRDGVVGPATSGALERASVPAPRSRAGGLHVEIGIPRQVMYIVQDGEVTDVFDVSTGSGETYEVDGDVGVAVTPTGEYSVERKIDGLRVSALGTLYRPAYFVGGYAIHGSPSVPPYPASHGCVRVTNPVMDLIYERLAIGTPVQVHG